MIQRVRGRVAASTVAPLIIRVRGCSVIKDVDLAALFGVGIAGLYDRIGAKLWSFETTSIFKLPKRPRRRRSEHQPLLAFDAFGVMMIAAILGDDTSLEVGLDISNALSKHRWKSAKPKRPSSLASDHEKWACVYELETARLRGRLYRLWTKAIKTRR